MRMNTSIRSPDWHLMVEGAAYKAFTEVSNFAWAKPRHQRPGGRYFYYFNYLLKYFLWGEGGMAERLCRCPLSRWLVSSNPSGRLLCLGQGGSLWVVDGARPTASLRKQSHWAKPTHLVVSGHSSCCYTWRIVAHT